MSKRSTHHATFAIERTYTATPARVFAAMSDPAAKARWFAGPESWERGEYQLDFRVGGRELAGGGPPRRPGPHLRRRVPGHRARRAHHLFL